MDDFEKRTPAFELEGHMTALRSEGLVDCRIKVFATDRTVPEGLVVALANALRLYRSGASEELAVA